MEKYFRDLQHIYISLLALLIGVTIGSMVVYLAGLILRNFHTRLPTGQRLLLLAPWRTPIVMLLPLFSLPELSWVFGVSFDYGLEDAIILAAGQIACFTVLFGPSWSRSERTAPSPLIQASGILRTLATLSAVFALMASYFSFEGLGGFMSLYMEFEEYGIAREAWNSSILICLAIDLLGGVMQFFLWNLPSRSRGPRDIS